MFGTEVNEIYLDRLYDDFSKEQQRLMEELKQCTDKTKQQDVTRQITLVNSMMMTTLRFRNLKQTIKLRLNC